VSERAELPARAQQWVLSAVPGAVRVASAQRLYGGISAQTHLLEVARLDGLPSLQLVLKRYTSTRPAPQPPAAVEAATLVALSGVTLPFSVPRLIAHDPVGRVCDLPALLMTRARGKIALELTHWERRVSALGHGLASFHAAQVPCPASLTDYDVGLQRRKKAVPAGIEAPDWSRVWPLVEERSWRGDALLHGDYHIGNALFEAAELSGIIDWATARRGPEQLDVAYCRLDLAMVIGPAAPAIFTAAYETARRTKLSELSRWDLAASLQAYPDPALWLPGWLDAGRADLTPELIRSRLCDFVSQALEDSQ
jgi:aminoglycoside phosphotransferase (APT) family kinase protein